MLLNSSPAGPLMLLNSSPAGPLDIALFPHDIVSPDDGAALGGVDALRVMLTPSDIVTYRYVTACAALGGVDALRRMRPAREPHKTHLQLEEKSNRRSASCDQAGLWALESADTYGLESQASGSDIGLYGRGIGASRQDPSAHHRHPRTLLAHHARLAPPAVYILFMGIHLRSVLGKGSW